MTNKTTKPAVLSAGTMIGDPVRNATGDDLGEIKELMIDTDTGHIAYAVLSFGGFLGIGDKLFAVPWDALGLSTEEKKFILNVPKEKLEKAPGFDKNNWPDMSNREWGGSIYKYYGYAPYWTAGSRER
jgi:hypothetical protein